MTSSADRFSRAQAATARALAEDRRFTPVIEAARTDSRAEAATADAPDRAPLAGRNVVRGLVDLDALQRKHHSPAEHARHAPTAPAARALYDWTEEARITALARQVMIGVAANLDTALEQRCRDVVPDPVAADVDTPLAMAAGLWVREQLTGRPLPATAAAIVGSRRHRIAAALGPFIPELQAALRHPAVFAARATDLPRALGMPLEDASGSMQASTLPADEPDEGDDPGQDAGAPADSETDSGDDARAPGGRMDNTPPQAWTPPTTDDTTPTDPDGISVREAPTGKPGAYRVFTRAFDTTVRVGAHCDRARLERLYQQLHRDTAAERTAIARLARRLERALLAQQRRHWAFDQDEGLLDAARLASVVIDPTLGLPYKREASAPFPDTVLTLLIDCSGSMRGRPIRLAALCALAVGEALARCNVKVEVLGFTTRAWQGGKSGARWAGAGHPPAPGRLNDLHHLIFKGADEPWRRTRRNLGLLLDDDLLKENIDGEALHWAHSRLLGRREERRVLLVISDGLPRDGMTQDANPSGFLEAHLRHVIDHIEARSPVELAAIGIGHDVTAYYRNAVAIPAADRLGRAVTDQLLALFATAPPHSIRNRSSTRTASPMPP